MYNYIKKISYILIIIGIIMIFFKISKMYFIKNNKKDFYTIIQNNLLNHKINNKDEVKHLLHQYSNKPWAALYTAALYFMGIALGALLFLSIQYAAQAGWSIILFRIIETITTFFPYSVLFILIILILNCVGIINMFHWMDNLLYNKSSIYYNENIFNKHFFLNKIFYLIRSLIYIISWTIFIFYFKYLSNKLDKTNYIKYQNKLYNLSIFFLIIFSVTFIIMVWDWIMSLDTHWISTLFSWYVLSGFLVTGITMITIISIILNKQGIFYQFNHHHLHDLAKYIFASSMLWSYLWGAQFLLYWYGNIPEEVNYFIDRSELYNNIHLWMLIPNLLIPFFCLISSKAKRNYKIVLFVACSILVGQYINIYNMIMPTTVGIFYEFGYLECGALLLITGLFLYRLQYILKKISLIPKGNKLLHESIIFEYPY